MDKAAAYKIAEIGPHPFNSADLNSNNPLANEVIKYGITIGA